MARMNGCNDHFESMKKAQGKNTVRPGEFARNNMSKGGVNTDLGGGAKPIKQGVKAGGAAQGKHHHMPKGK